LDGESLSYLLKLCYGYSKVFKDLTANNWITDILHLKAGDGDDQDRDSEG
jgi:hypothetical protein